MRILMTSLSLLSCHCFPLGLCVLSWVTMVSWVLSGSGSCSLTCLCIYSVAGHCGQVTSYTESQGEGVAIRI